MRGYIYVLSNPSMEGIYKIGCTSDTIQNRIKELYNSSVPTAFKEEFSYYVSDMEKSEALVHKELKEFRVSENREFFKTDLKTINHALKCLYIDNYNYIRKFSNIVQISGTEHYKDNYIHFLDNNHKTIKENDYKFDYFTDIYKKGNKYYNAICYVEVCTEQQYQKWVNSKKVLDKDSNIIVGTIKNTE